MDLVTIIDAWTIPNYGVITELEHHLDGLAKDTLLVSLESGLQWIVQSRILESIAVDESIRFANETETIQFVNISDLASREVARTNILQKNQNRIFQYLLLPNGHTEKPKAGEMLKVA